MKKILYYIFLTVFFLNVSNQNCFPKESAEFPRWREAVENMEEEDFSGGQRYALALYYLYNDEYDKALRLSEELIKEYPYIAEGYIFLAKAKIKSGAGEEAEEIYTRCTEAVPNDMRAYLYRAVLRCKQKRYKEAINDYDKALSLGNMPDNFLYWNFGDLYINRAAAKYLSGDLEGALKDYENAKNAYKEQSDIFYYDRGLCKFDSGDIEGAKADYQKAVELNPQAGYVYYDKNR